MIKLFGRTPLMSFTLLYTGVMVLLWCIPTNASELKDIRVGMHKGFTRIVFEFDKPAPDPLIEIQSSRQLLVTLNRTNINLVRKIPMGPNAHVNDIQIWQQKETLSTLLFFDYPHFRYKAFSLNKPPRFAVDVFPVAKPLNQKAGGPAPPIQTDDKKKPTEQILTQIPLKDHKEPSVPSPENTTPSSVDSSSVSPKEQVVAKKVPVRSKQPVEGSESGSASEQGEASRTGEVRMESNSPETGGDEVRPSAALQKKPILKSTKIVEGDSFPKKTSSPNKRPLQYYLILILVIITIVILSLLLLMLLNRHQFFGEKNPWNTIDNSQDQIKKI